MIIPGHVLELITRSGACTPSAAVAESDPPHGYKRPSVP